MGAWILLIFLFASDMGHTNVDTVTIEFLTKDSCTKAAEYVSDRARHANYVVDAYCVERSYK